MAVGFSAENKIPIMLLCISPHQTFISGALPFFQLQYFDFWRPTFYSWGAAYTTDLINNCLWYMRSACWFSL